MPSPFRRIATASAHRPRGTSQVMNAMWQLKVDGSSHNLGWPFLYELAAGKTDHTLCGARGTFILSEENTVLLEAIWIVDESSASLN